MSLKQRGAALITSLITIVIVAGIALLMFNRTMAEMGHSRDNVAITQTLMLARGGANVGGAFLNGYVNDIQAVINNPSFSNPNNRWTFGGNGTAEQPNPVDVANAMNSLASTLQTRVNTALCNNNYAPVGSSAVVSVRVHFTATACGKSLPNKTILPNGRFVQGEPRDTGNPNSFQVYALPFVMVAEARQGDYKRNIVLQGEYRFNVGRSSFARFAYFANERKVDGRPVTFGSREMIDGPVHSNEYLRYRDTPWFGGPVTVAGCVSPTVTSCGSTVVPGDYFNGNLQTPATIPGYCSTPGNCPTFAGGVTWGAKYIALPTNNFNQRDAATKAGLAFNNTLKDLQLSVLTEGSKTYQVMRVETCSNAPTSTPNDLTCTNPTVVKEFRFTDNEVKGKGFPLQVKDTSGNWVDYTNGTQQYYFQGVLYTAGGIASLGGPVRTNSTDPATAPPAIASFAQLTIAATGKVVVTRDLKYSDPPCSSAAQWNGGNVIRATCANTTAKNVLGVYTQDGDLLFGTGNSSTLLNLTAQGAFMSSEGRVGTNNWDAVQNADTNLNITGGLIGKVVAGFYHSDGGYRRNITYDPRLGEGTVPPFFPSTGEDKADKPTFFSYGQREQVY
jgi:hypothetical protein